MRNVARYLVVILAAGCVCGCGKSKDAERPFVHRNAVFRASSGPDAATSQVERNYAMDKSGRPEHFSGAMRLRQGRIKVWYEFAGTAFCPLSSDGDQWGQADVYVVSVSTEGGKTETIPTVYTGGESVVVDRPDLRIVLSQ